MALLQCDTIFSTVHFFFLLLGVHPYHWKSLLRFRWSPPMIPSFARLRVLGGLAAALAEAIAASLFLLAFNEPGVPRGGASSLGTVFIGDDDDDDGGGGLAAGWGKVENLGCERASDFTPLNVNIKEFISSNPYC